MGRVSSTLRITIGLACLALTVLLCAQMIGLVPNREAILIDARTDLCETIAIECSLLASQNNIPAIESSLEAVLQRNPAMVFARVRQQDGPVKIQVGRAPATGPAATPSSSNGTGMVVPILAGNKPWGKVEIGFRPLVRGGIPGFFDREIIRLSVFTVVASFLLYFLYLRRLLQDLDPSKVIPKRVRTTLDTFAEGLLVLDQKERIVLANRSFARTMGQAPATLQGRRASDLPWTSHDDTDDTDDTTIYPWQHAIDEGNAEIGKMLDLCPHGTNVRTFMVNASPIVGDEGETRGALASFDDVTLMEQNRAKLSDALTQLKQSRDEVHRKNVELQKLANHDPLTSCLNRRSFFEHFEAQWGNAMRHGYPLAYVMVDIDHFKSINDQHGHRTGDEVLRTIGSILRSTVRLGDIVCRYGGEEFGVLLPHTDIEEAVQAAQRYRCRIEETAFGEVHVTASLGVSTTELGATTFQELIDQADKCLYVAKGAGRNRVCRWDQVPEDVKVSKTMVSEIPPVQEHDVAIPFHAVTALISALSFRDTGTAEHSRRVADLCAAVASQCMPAGEAYVLETAALLHDIGKIGVPDSILLKPGPLTAEEWRVMEVHDRIGIEIIKSAFACDKLTDMISSHHAWFAGNPRNASLPTGHDIPLGARILTIADAFDAITSDRVYRAGRSVEEAFAELQRCAGTQFDPELVEVFIQCVLARDDSRRDKTPTVSKQTALRIGLQIENLAGAMDKQDFDGLAAQAQRLRKTATKYGVPHIAEVAGDLEELADDGADEMKLATLTNELLELCRSTQTAYLGGAPGRHGEMLESDLDAARMNNP